MGEKATERFVGGATVSALGSVLAAVTLLDVYEDAVLQSDPLYLTLLENSLPLVFDSVLMVAGWMLVTGQIPYNISPRRVTGWSLFGGFAVFSITGWIYYFQILQSVLKPHVIFTQVVAMGAIAGLLIGVYDGRRTEREAELRIERDRTSTLFENSSDCIAEVEFIEDQPVVRRINDAFRRTFEVSDDDIVGERLDDIIVPPKRDDSAARINQKAETGNHVEDEVFRQTTSGEIRVFRLQVIPLETAGQDTDSYAVYTDITDQHRYESGMASLHDTTRELIDSESIEEITDRAVTAAADALDLRISGIFLYDPSTDRLEPAAQTTAATELVGEPDAFEREEAISWRVFETDEPEYVRDVHARSDAYNRESPLRSEMILPLGKWGVLIVGSKSVDAFDDLDLSLSRTLAANVEAAMNRAERQQELKQQNERLDTFASVVSHDLRNPLGVARGFLELAQEGDRDALDRVEDALDRMDHLIETLLTLARSGEAVGELEAVSLEDAARTAWDTARTADGTLEIEIPEEADPTVRADPERLQQLFENLFRNAVEHGSTSSRTNSDDAVEHGTTSTRSGVTVRFTRFSGGFAVEDDGKGIPESERDEILEQGYTTDEDGTGLGLMIVRQIADAHGWTISIEESDSGGARFEFETSGT